MHNFTRKKQSISGKEKGKRDIPPVEINRVLILEMETGGWPRLLRRRSRVRKNKKMG
nr:MAG TPA: hypothetical protein [Caudoviricetes sp.]